MYRTSLPVVGSEFRDREEALARVLGSVDRLVAGAPEWLALLGPRKVGKTSLILEARRRLTRDNVVFATLDAFELAPVTVELFRLLALRVVDAVFGPECGRSLEATARPADYRSALAGSRRLAELPPDLRDALLALREAKLDAGFVAICLGLPERLAVSLGLHIVVAIDEFQEIAELRVGRPAAEVLPMMRSLWQKHRRVAYIVAGSARGMMTRLVAAETSPFFGHFSLLEIGPFDKKNAMALLTEGASPDKPIPDAVAARAVEILGGIPFYLQLLGDELAALAPPIGEDALKEALSRLLFHSTGRLSLFFEGELLRMVGRSPVFMTILEEVARGPQRMTDIQAALRASSSLTVNYLARLGDALTRDADGRYRLSDPVMAYWLRWRAPGGAAVPMTVLGDEGERRVADQLAALGFELVYQSRASRGAFDLLAIRAGLMLGVQVKRSALPLRFTAPAWKRMEAEARRLGWLWIVAAAEPEGEVRFLDPRKAARGGASLGTRAVIPNLLLWIDEAGAPRAKRKR